MCESIDLTSLKKYPFENFNEENLREQHKNHIDIFKDIKSSLNILSDELSELVTIIDKTQESFNQHDKSEALISLIIHFYEKINQYLKDLPCKDVNTLNDITKSIKEELINIKSFSDSLNIQLPFKDIILPNVKQSLIQLIEKIGNNMIDLFKENSILFNEILLNDNQNELSNIIGIYSVIKSIIFVDEIIDNKNYTIIDKACMLYEELLKNAIDAIIEQDFKNVESFHDFLNIQDKLKTINEIDFLIWREENETSILNDLHSKHRLKMTVQLLDNTLTNQLKEFYKLQDTDADIFKYFVTLNTVLKFWNSKEGPLSLLDDESKYQHVLCLKSVKTCTSSLSSQLNQHDKWSKLFENYCNDQEKWFKFLSICTLLLLYNPNDIWIEDIIIESTNSLGDANKDSLQTILDDESKR